MKEMLMDVTSNNNKTLDGFYNELRRKYPDAFTLANSLDLGRRNGSLQKLPRLEKSPSPVLGIPPNSPSVASPQRWSPDSFLSKVKYQKTQNEQRKELEKPEQIGNAVIIKDQAIPMPTWTRKDYLEAQNGALFHLPTLRTQIEQNKVELKNRFNLPKNTETNQGSTLQTSNSAQTKTSSDYTTTKSTNDYTNTQTTTKTSRDYTTTKSTNNYTNTQTTRYYTTTKTPRDYTTTNDYTTTKPSKDYTSTQTITDYSTTKTSGENTTTKSTRDYTTALATRDYTTTKTSKDYITTKTTNNYTTTVPFKDYTSTQTITDYATIDDYTTTKTTNDYTSTKTTGDYTTMGSSSPSRTNIPGVKSDPLGTIMKELLPNKPSQLIKDLPKTTNRVSNNGGYISDSDSGVTVCSPMKVFRPKIRSPQAPPASRDIIKKFSTKHKRTSEPLKADHSLVRENITQIVQTEDNPVTRYSKSSINFNEKIPQGLPRARVHFEDESEEDAELRYRERCLLERTQTTKISTNISPGPRIKYMEKNAPETTEISSSPFKEGDKPKSTDQQTMTLPHRRQPFPPNVAKKVLIDIPRGDLPSRRVSQLRLSPVMRDITNKQFSPRNVTSLDGITMSFSDTNLEWGEQAQSITALKEDERGHHSLSSLETIESGTTEVSSEVTIMKMEWGESNSSIGSGNQSRSSSQNRDLNLDHTSQNKGAETSFYSKMRRSFRLKKKLSPEATSGSHHSEFIPKNAKEPDQSSYTSIHIDGGAHRKSSPHGAAICRLTNQTAANDSIPSRGGMSRTKKDVMGDVETQGTERTHPVKAPYSPMKMMQSLLKKGRAKDYLVRVPSPPPKEARPPTLNFHSSKYRREQIPGQVFGRVLSIQSDSSRLVELERPKMGFSGLYLTKKNQNGYSGLYVVQLSEAFTSSFPQGILEVGDEILEINRLQAKDLRLDEIYTLLEESSCILLKVSRKVYSSS